MTKHDLVGQVVCTFINDRPTTLETTPAHGLSLTFDGISSDRHSGRLAHATDRYPFYERGTPILNTRHVSLVSVEELGHIQKALQIDYVVASWLGANVALMNIPHLSLLPIGARLFFSSGAVLLNMGYNPPCTGPGHIINRYFPSVPANRFPKAAQYKRGIVAMVEREGAICDGDTVSVQLPTQPHYPPATPD